MLEGKGGEIHNSEFALMAACDNPGLSEPDIDGLFPFAPRLHRPRSITVSIAGGLLLIITLFCGIVIISLLGFIDCRKGLTELSTQAFTQLNNQINLVTGEIDAEEKIKSNLSGLFDLTSSIGIKTLTLTDKVNQLIRILTILFTSALLVTVLYFVYFRHLLLARLLRLNGTILAIIAGKQQVLAVEGCDELSEIAASVNYLVKEIDKAKKNAAHSVSSQAEFLAHMSHEIRTPLNAILGFSDLALKSISPVEHLDYLKKINNASYSLLGIINAVLDFSKIEAGKFTLENAAFDLRELLESLSSLVSVKCEESGLNLYFHIEPDTPYALRGDALRLNQVLINLITNAFKFTESGFISIHIKALSKEKEGASDQTRLFFAVQDSGSGISDESG